MADVINRICPYCGHKMVMDSYKVKHIEFITYCDNDDCPVQPCTDSTYPSAMYQDMLSITGDKE